VAVVGIPGEPNDIEVDEKPAPMWFFENGVVEVLVNPFSQLALVGRRADNTAAAKTVVRKPPK
jgi:hypothetical protein